ncbi:MAG: hypothetical protein IAE78_05475 [Myxococcus sp.]|nr:hypothetical protein [Myxococcus sp.]
MACLPACVECPTAPALTSVECASLSTLRLAPAVPASAGNRFADDEAAALLGFELFFDARLSRDGSVRCASCHIPERQFADARATSMGLERVDRNSPSIYGAAWHRWQMWDGKADSLWSQPLLAFENEKEMDFTRLELAHRVAASYRARYEALFGALPALEDAARFPARGRPGLPAFDAMAQADRDAINLVAANVGKALEAYQRRLAFGPGRLERFVDGDARALTDAEREGLVVFSRKGCLGCHRGGLLSDDDFHAVGLVDAPPRARAEALVVLRSSPFTSEGPFHDGEQAPLPAARAEDEGAYRTPTLRNVARTGPWGHDGRFAELGAAVEAHVGGPPLSSTELSALLAFLGALDAGDPPLPWNGWPDR